MTDPAHTQSPDALTCRQLAVQRGPRRVLHDISLEIGPADCLTLIGPNGSGKTTLMLALLGLLPPVAGSVRVGTRALRSLPARTRGRLLSYVPQVVERLPGFRVYDVIAAGRFPHVPPLQALHGEDLDAVQAALDACGLGPLAERPINALSGGERQKVLLAAAIAQDAQWMCLDEPNTALDPAHQVELVELLRGWHARGRGLILISHDLHLPAALGGRVVALRDGRVVADGPSEAVLEPTRLSAIYGTDFTVAQTPDGQRVVVPRWR